MEIPFYWARKDVVYIDGSIKKVDDLSEFEKCLFSIQQDQIGNKNEEWTIKLKMGNENED